jgi:hypothetical protein
MNIFLSGMKILEWNTSTGTSMIFMCLLCLSVHYIQFLVWLIYYILLSRYMNLVIKHGLEISQPGIEPNNGLTWEMTKRRGDRDVHTYYFGLPLFPTLSIDVIWCFFYDSKLSLNLKTFMLCWCIGSLMRNRDGVVIHICLLVLRMLSSTLDSS